MDPILFVAFLTTTLLIVATPGPSCAFAATQAIRNGPRAALVAVCGDALGSAVHIAVAVAGLATLLSLSELILPFLQIAGGVFILWMALQSFRASPETADTPPDMRLPFWAGFFACVTNPKAIVFFVALFPSFISPVHDILFQTLVYGAIFIALDAASIAGYAFLAMHAVRRTTGTWFRLNVVSGLGLGGVGVSMIVKGFRAIPSQG